MSQQARERGIRDIAQALGTQVDDQTVRQVHEGMTYDYLDSLCDKREEQPDGTTGKKD